MGGGNVIKIMYIVWTGIVDFKCKLAGQMEALVMTYVSIPNQLAPFHTHGKIGNRWAIKK